MKKLGKLLGRLSLIPVTKIPCPYRVFEAPWTNGPCPWGEISGDMDKGLRIQTNNCIYFTDVHAVI